MYSFQSRARYSELNHFKGCMDPSSIINYFQDCSTFQSEDMNRGLAFLQAKNRVWLLNSWHLKLFHPIRLGDLIEIGTWPYAFRGFYGYRNFIMKGESEEVLAVANSIWVYIDTATGRPTRIPPDLNGYKIEPPYPMESMSRKLELPDNLRAEAPITVIKSNIDSYNHVNNGQYIKIAEEFLPNSFHIEAMKVEYRMQAVLGDVLYPLISEGEHCYTIALSDHAHKPYAIIEFHGTHIDESTRKDNGNGD
jgi:medium-chain acyl-[acyl-carrier-protein] hydrolase